MLTTEELRAIQAADPSPTVKRLLWDIFRLRLVIRSANQVQEHSGEHHSAPLDILIRGLRKELKELPFLEEERARRARILYDHGETNKPKGIDNQ